MKRTRSGTGRVVILLSGAGTLAQAVIDAAAQQGYVVAAVISDRADAVGLERAKAAGIATAVVAPADFADRPTWDKGIAKAVAAFDPDLVVLAGFMRLLGEPYVAEFGPRTINSHPALLPSFPGAHGVRDALAYGVKVTGCSVILVDEGTDTGPVVAQRAVTVEPEDTLDSLHERIKQAERELLPEVVAQMALQGWTVTGRQVLLGEPRHDNASVTPNEG